MALTGKNYVRHLPVKVVPAITMRIISISNEYCRNKLFLAHVLRFQQQLYK